MEVPCVRDPLSDSFSRRASWRSSPPAPADVRASHREPRRDRIGQPDDSHARRRSEADWRKAIDVYGERYRTNPKDAEAALRYGQALRATGQRAQATAVLEQAAIVNPGDRALLAAYGRALVDNGNYQQGFDTLSRAHTPDNPDWHILSVQGTALDRLGRHDEARRYYSNALKIKPDEPSVLSNLGMSYVLSKQLAKAEEALRRAHEGASVRHAHPAEPRTGGRTAGPHGRGRKHHRRRPAAGRSRRKRQRS